MQIQSAGEMAHQVRVRTSMWKFCGDTIKSKILSKEDETTICTNISNIILLFS